MKEKLNPKILYLSFHNSLCKVHGVNTILSKKEIFSKLGRQYLVPKGLRIVALKELENLELIKKENGENYRILKGNFNIEEDTSKFYQKLNLF